LPSNQELVAHTYNPSYSRDRDQEDPGLRFEASLGKIKVRLYLKTKSKTKTQCKLVD
jgi:hypothetical protein